MSFHFPSSEWVSAFSDKLNSDDKYAKIAHKWEGDLIFVIEPDEDFQEEMVLYLDLWHGTCRSAYVMEDASRKDAAFILKAPFTNWLRILEGKLHPMQAMLTQKLRVKGNMAYMMRNVPTVLDFVRCAQEVDAQPA